MSSDNEILFGPEGLANTNKAVLITAGTFESLNYEGSYKAYQEFGSTDKTFISFVRANHDMIDGVSPPEKMEHLAIAFFSYHLKG
ncbi:MAG: hypothetical protein GWN30_35750, partial [Gammaproteobacteria bacterium]|nr:hypothetical protein [Gammaproteobacteria bacterium]